MIRGGYVTFFQSWTGVKIEIRVKSSPNIGSFAGFDLRGTRNRVAFILFDSCLVFPFRTTFTVFVVARVSRSILRVLSG